MAMDEREKGFRVKITHFTNPYKFYIKLEDSSQVFEENFSDFLERKALEVASQCPNGYAPKRNEHVIVFILQSNKWIRAICEHVLRTSKHFEDEYILWDLENG